MVLPYLKGLINKEKNFYLICVLDLGHILLENFNIFVDHIYYIKSFHYNGSIKTFKL